MTPNILAVFQLANGYVFVGFQVFLGIVLTVFVASFAGKALKKSFTRVSKNIKMDETQFVVLRRIIVAVIYVFGITITLSLIPGFTNVWISILTGAGVIAVIVGFAAQKTVGNIISGLFIAFFRPFRVGDRVTIKGEHGLIEDITLVHTIIVTEDNKRVVVPNSTVSDETIQNYTIGEDDFIGKIDIGIGYGADIEKARKIMIEEAGKHPLIGRSVKPTIYLEKGQKYVVRVTELKDYCVNLRLFFWARNFPDANTASYELLESIKKRFDSEGIEI